MTSVSRKLFIATDSVAAGDWSWSLGNKQGALCPFSSPACLPDSHGPMIDCSLSAFVLGNCFVLLTVCLRSRPDSRDIAAPFFAYLQNMFKTVSKLITVEYVKVGEGWGGTLELSHMFSARRCVTGFGENETHTLEMEVRLYLSVCCLWGLTSFRVD